MKTFLSTFPSGLHPRERLLFRILLVASFLFSAFLSMNVFDSVPHIEDEHAYLFQAKVFAAGSIVAPSPPEPDAFSIQFVVDKDGKRFSKYTPGFSLVLAPSVRLNVPWLTNSVAFVLCLIGVYLLGARLFDPRTGAIALSLAVLSPVFVVNAGNLMPHLASTAEILFFILAFLKCRETCQPRFGLYAGICLGLAVITRPLTALAITAPFAILGLKDLVEGFRGSWRYYAAMAFAFLPVFIIWPIYNYEASGSFFQNLYQLWWPFDTVGFGPGKGILEQGHSWEAALRNFHADFRSFLNTSFGWPGQWGRLLFATVVFLGIALSPGKRLLAISLLIPPIFLISSYLAYWVPGGGLFGPRYYFEALPFIWILGARCIEWLGTRKRLEIPVALAVSALSFFAVKDSTLPTLEKLTGLYETDRESYREVISAGVDNALVFVTNRKWTDYSKFSWANSPFLEGSIVFARDRGDKSNCLVVQHFPERAAYIFDRYAEANRLSKYYPDCG